MAAIAAPHRAQSPRPAVSRSGSAHPAHRCRNSTRCRGHAVRWCNRHGSRITARSPQHPGHTAAASRVFPCAPMSGHSAIGSTAGSAGRGVPCATPYHGANRCSVSPIKAS